MSKRRSKDLTRREFLGDSAMGVTSLLTLPTILGLLQSRVAAADSFTTFSLPNAVRFFHYQGGPAIWRSFVGMDSSGNPLPAADLAGHGKTTADLSTLAINGSLYTTGSSIFDGINSILNGDFTGISVARGCARTQNDTSSNPLDIAVALMKAGVVARFNLTEFVTRSNSTTVSGQAPLVAGSVGSVTNAGTVGAFINGATFIPAIANMTQVEIDTMVAGLKALDKARPPVSMTPEAQMHGEEHSSAMTSLTNSGTPAPSTTPQALNAREPDATVPAGLPSAAGIRTAYGLTEAAAATVSGNTDANEISASITRAGQLGVIIAGGQVTPGGDYHRDAQGNNADANSNRGRDFNFGRDLGKYLLALRLTNTPGEAWVSWDGGMDGHVAINPADANESVDDGDEDAMSGVIRLAFNSSPTRLTIGSFKNGEYGTGPATGQEVGATIFANVMAASGQADWAARVTQVLKNGGFSVPKITEILQNFLFFV